MARGVGIQQKILFASGERPVICPKPRRPVTGDLRWTLAQLADPFNSAPANDLHILLPKISSEPVEQSDPIQPFFCGSPPTRSANPVVLDTRFGKANPLRPVQCSTDPGSANRQNGFERTQTQYSFDPAVIRIEGFDCLNCNCSRTRGIPAVA